MRAILVAGIGCEMRGDDAAGLLAARALRAIAPPGVDVEDFDGDVATLAESIARHAEVILIDAIAGDLPAGTVLVLPEDNGQTRATASSHGLGLRDAVGLARVLGASPRVHIIGIAGADFRVGAPPSADVAAAANAVAVEIREALPCA